MAGRRPRDYIAKMAFQPCLVPGHKFTEVEEDLSAKVVCWLRARCREVDLAPTCNAMMGHAVLRLNPGGMDSLRLACAL